MFKVGDKVKVIKKSRVDSVWIYQMDKYVGKIGFVTDIRYQIVSKYIRLNLGDYYYPIESLELIEKKEKQYVAGM